MLHRSARFALVALPFLIACSSSAASPAAEADAASAQPGDDAATTELPDAAPPDHCAAVTLKSGCDNAGSWVRGIAHFDPARVPAGTLPILRVALRHSFVLASGEETIGGRLHAFLSVPVGDVSTGQVPFVIDMCDGAAMWSEENGAFHVVLILDNNHNNDVDRARTLDEALAASTPDVGELTKVVDVDVSCNAPSPCLDVTLDCADGKACTTFQPITACTKKAPGCKSISAYCK